MVAHIDSVQHFAIIGTTGLAAGSCRNAGKFVRTKQVLTMAIDSLARHARNGIPPQLPQHGWFLDSEWVDSLYGKMSRPAYERRLKTFRKNLKDAGKVRFKWGDVSVIHTADFFGFDTSSFENGVAPRLPQTGVFADHEWAAAFEEEVDTFRRKVRQNGVPHIMWGTLMLVRAEDLFERMIQIAPGE